MKFLEILPHLETLQVFSVQDIKNIDPKYNKTKIAWWVKKDYLIALRRWYYILWKNKNTISQYFIANKIYTPSYISLESALHIYGIIPEYPFTTTSVSTKKTQKFQTTLWNYSFSSMKTELFWGYVIQNMNQKILIAELEKCILDFLYLKDQYTDIDDFRWLRWNREELRIKLDRKKLLKYTSIIENKKIDKKIQNLLDYIDLW